MVGTRYVSLGSERLSATSGINAEGIDPSSSLGLNDATVIRAVVTIEEGPLRWNSIPGQTATQDGSDGSTIEYTDAQFIIWGTTEIDNFRFIPAGDKRVTIMVRYEGTQ